MGIEDNTCGRNNRGIHAEKMNKMEERSAGFGNAFPSSADTGEDDKEWLFRLEQVVKANMGGFTDGDASHLFLPPRPLNYRNVGQCVCAGDPAANRQGTIGIRTGGQSENAMRAGGLAHAPLFFASVQRAFWQIAGCGVEKVIIDRNGRIIGVFFSSSFLLLQKLLRKMLPPFRL
jgi:hypothetical protein